MKQLTRFISLIFLYDHNFTIYKNGKWQFIYTREYTGLSLFWVVLLVLIIVSVF